MCGNNPNTPQHFIRLKYSCSGLALIWIAVLEHRIVERTPKQCVPSFCKNNPFRSFVWETAPFQCLANFDYPEQWVLSITTWKTSLFYKMHIFPTLNDDTLRTAQLWKKYPSFPLFLFYFFVGVVCYFLCFFFFFFFFFVCLLLLFFFLVFFFFFFLFLFCSSVGTKLGSKRPPRGSDISSWKT